MLVDMANAFNCLNRAALFQGVSRLAPPLARYVATFYGGGSNYLFTDCDGTRRIRGERGIEQGDSLGPALFALGFQSALEAFRAALPRPRPT